MNRILIYGSKNSSLRNKQKEYIKNLLKDNNFILLNNCYKIDYQLQNYLYKQNYKKVTIFSLIHKLTTKIDKDWYIHFINSTNENVYTKKDIKMINLCDFGIFILEDIVDQEIIINIFRLINLNKKVILFKNNDIHIIENIRDFDNIINTYFKK